LRGHRPRVGFLVAVALGTASHVCSRNFDEGRWREVMLEQIDGVFRVACLADDSRG
jgi:hypothetical protein